MKKLSIPLLITTLFISSVAAQDTTKVKRDSVGVIKLNALDEKIKEALDEKEKLIKYKKQLEDELKATDVNIERVDAYIFALQMVRLDSSLYVREKKNDKK